MGNFLIAMFFMFVFDIVFYSMYQDKIKSIKRSERTCTVWANAVVCDEIIVKERMGKYLHNHSYPVFKYNVGGEEVTTKYGLYSIVDGQLKPQYTVGMQVDIKYNPQDPSKIFIPSNKVPYQEGQMYLIFIAIISAGCLMVGFISLLFSLFL